MSYVFSYKYLLPLQGYLQNGCYEKSLKAKNKEFPYLNFKPLQIHKICLWVYVFEGEKYD